MLMFNLRPKMQLFTSLFVNAMKVLVVFAFQSNLKNKTDYFEREPTKILCLKIKCSVNYILE